MQTHCYHTIVHVCTMYCCSDISATRCALLYSFFRFLFAYLTMQGQAVYRTNLTWRWFSKKNHITLVSALSSTTMLDLAIGQLARECAHHANPASTARLAQGQD